jgi:hypothetical protein
VDVVKFRARVGLRLVAYETETTWLERILRAIEKEIAVGMRRFEKIRSSKNDLAAEAWADDECEQIEEMLGVAFIACHSFINRVWRRVEELNRFCEEEFHRKLPSFSCFQDVFAIGRETLRPSGLGGIEAIFAVGNYRKHSEEWPVTEKTAQNRRKLVWDLGGMNNLQRRTAETVVRLGLEYGSTGNLRDAAKAVGVLEFEDLSPIWRAIAEWAGEILSAARREIEQFTKAQGGLAAGSASQPKGPPGDDLS